MIGIYFAKFFKWIVLGSFMVVLYLFVSAIDYVDVTNFCYIKINTEPLNGNRATIIAALKNLKKNDPEAYKGACEYVDRVQESYCDLLHLKSPKNAPWHKADGCYVKGSRTIYLKPLEENAAATIQKRSELIRKFSLQSKDFWEK